MGCSRERWAFLCVTSLIFLTFTLMAVQRWNSREFSFRHPRYVQKHRGQPSKRGRNFEDQQSQRADEIGWGWYDSHFTFVRYYDFYTLFSELNCSVAHLALAWVAVNPNTSTVILGASRPEQVLDNLKALEVIPKLTPEVLEKIEAILENKPAVVS